MPTAHTPINRAALSRLSTAVAAAVAMAMALPAAAHAAPPAAVKLSPKDNALHIVRGGVRASDFSARGMAYRGLAWDKGNAATVKQLEDGTTDPQWVVRAGVASAFYALGNAKWKQVVRDALVLPVLSPLEVLPVLDDMAEKDAVALLLTVLADKEHEQHDKIVNGIVTRNRALTTAFFVAALASKDPLVSGAAQKGIVRLDPLVQAKTLEAIAKAQAANDTVAKALVEVAKKSDERLPAGYLAFSKTKDLVLADQLLILRAQHGDTSVSRGLMGLCLRSKDAQQAAALQAFRQVGSKADAEGLKPILQQAPTTDVVFQIYEILARAGDRSMQKEAQQLADSTDPDVRATGVFYLGWVGGAGRIGEMHKYLSDGIPAVRTAAARVLAHIASPISVAPLKEAIDVETEDSVRLEAVKALAAIKDKQAYDALALFSRGSKFLSVRATVVRALAESGDPAARPGLNNALNDNDPRIRAEAVRGFLLSDPASAPDVWKRALKWMPRGVITDLTQELGVKMESYLELTLVHAGKDDNGVLVREEAMMALHRLPDVEAKLLFKLLERTDDDDLKIRILRQLFQLDKAKVLVSVKSTALQSGVRARIAAIRMLGQYKGDKEGAELLSKFMEDLDERVRIAAALTVLGG